MKGKLIVIASFVLIASAVGWSADDGAALYKKKCAGCHGATGEGTKREVHTDGVSL